MPHELHCKDCGKTTEDIPLTGACISCLSFNTIVCKKQPEISVSENAKNRLKLLETILPEACKPFMSKYNPEGCHGCDAIRQIACNNVYEAQIHAMSQARHSVGAELLDAAKEAAPCLVQGGDASAHLGLYKRLKEAIDNYERAYK